MGCSSSGSRRENRATEKISPVVKDEERGKVMGWRRGLRAAMRAVVVGRRVVEVGLKVELARSRNRGNRSIGADGAGDVQDRKRGAAQSSSRGVSS